MNYCSLGAALRCRLFVSSSGLGIGRVLVLAVVLSFPVCSAWAQRNPPPERSARLVAEYGPAAEAAATLEDVLVPTKTRSQRVDRSSVVAARALVASLSKAGLKGDEPVQLARAWNLVGRSILALEGDTPDALAAFQTALKLNPNDEESISEFRLLKAKLDEVEIRLKEAESLRTAQKSDKRR